MMNMIAGKAQLDAGLLETLLGDSLDLLRVAGLLVFI
jgi:hypothetical protein